MSTSFFHISSLDDAVGSSKAEAHKPGVLGRFFSTIAKAREAQAEREVNRYLARQPDRLLRDIGLNHQEIAELRSQHPY